MNAVTTNLGLRRLLRTGIRSVRGILGSAGTESADKEKTVAASREPKPPQAVRAEIGSGSCWHPLQRGSRAQSASPEHTIEATFTTVDDQK